MRTIPDKLKKCDDLQKQINAIKPLQKEELEQLKAYYRIRLVYSSNAIEGNSLTETETKIVIENGLTIAGKPLKDHLEAVGHSEAFDLVLRLSEQKGIQEQDILDIHRLFYQKIDPLNAGKYRTIRVFISGSSYNVPPPQKIQELMKKFVCELNTLEKNNHPVIYAALLHKNFVMIHPFIDGNGRTARLLMNLALLQYGYQIAIIPNVLRNEYLQSLEECHRGNDTNFITLVINAVLESQSDYIRLLK